MSYLPTVAEAVEEAFSGKQSAWSHASVYLASESVGWAALDDVTICNRFKHEHFKLRQRVKAGEVLVCAGYIRANVPVARPVVVVRRSSAGEALAAMRERLAGG